MDYGNSNSQPLGTGCGASTAAVAESEKCAISYGSATSYLQSTTGNITGIFDMSGGAWERVMGVFANSDGTLWSGRDKTENSGFNGLLGTSGTLKTDGIDFPENKYYDVYKASTGTTISALTACNGSYCYGHGLSETSGWYLDYANFVSSTSPWFTRGGNYSYGASVFSFSNSASGNTFGSNGFRAVLVFEQ